MSDYLDIEKEIYWIEKKIKHYNVDVDLVLNVNHELYFLSQLMMRLIKVR